MISAPPLDAVVEELGAELGAIAASIGRDVKLSASVALAEVSIALAAVREEMAALRAQRAEIELRAVNAERALAEAASARLSEVRNGERGERGATLDVGNGPPSSGAHDGDLYVNAETGDLYRFRS